MANGTLVKKPATKLDTRLKIGPALGSYANLFEPRAATDKSEPKYSLSLIFRKEDIANPNTPAGKSFAQLEALCRRIAVLKFGPEFESIADFKWPIRDGDVDKPEMKEYAGAMFVNASGKRQPGIIDRHLKPVISESEAYSGCIYVCSINVFAFRDKPANGIALGLNNVLVFERGTRIDGRKEAAEDFAEYADDSTPAAPADSMMD